MNWRIRELRPGELSVIDRIFAGLSDHSRYLRFHAPVPRLTGTYRQALAHVDSTHVALVAELGPGVGAGAGAGVGVGVGVGVDRQPVGMVRMVQVRPGHAELSVEVVDAMHRRGVGASLLRAAARQAAAAGVRTAEASVLAGNRPVLRLVRAVFDDAAFTFDGPLVRVELQLGGNRSFTGGAVCR
ncbi:GNAT family N-acetyltransferase [Dactylosporangium sp. NPDC049525]|uniref:GNAT family N-acetyltransferase n=1 Tax=Dactylosporangium sp. NPDC049525 TaxID=3154730 RepID=UPI003444B752